MVLIIVAVTMINIYYNGKWLVQNETFSKRNGYYIFAKVVSDFIIRFGFEKVKGTIIVICSIKDREQKNVLYVERFLDLAQKTVYPFSERVVEERVLADDVVETLYRDKSRVMFSGDSNLEFKITF